MATVDFVQQANAVMDKFGLTEKGWKLHYDKAKRRAGCCFEEKKIITLSNYLIKKFNFTWCAEIENILLHEIAHALVGSGHGHDDVWRSKAIEIGCDGRRCHNFELAEPRLILACPCGKSVWKRHRVPKRGMAYRCKTCQGILVRT